ncbi:MAG: hypothetical protein M1482_01760 [Chloroflexi bacterium]|nr:hypothetical protein [Chloroflexota bacterium]
MSRLFRDTSEDAERVLIELARAAPVWRKLEMVGQLNEMVRAFAMSGLRSRHPNASREELRRRLAGLLLGEDLAERAYGPIEPKDRESD